MEFILVLRQIGFILKKLNSNKKNSGTSEKKAKILISTKINSTKTFHVQDELASCEIVTLTASAVNFTMVYATDQKMAAKKLKRTLEKRLIAVKKF